MRAHLTLAFALLLLCTGAVLASTPDGETPAEETVCDSETGAAYGLCNAYCEAMDCESDTPSASATACDKVRTKFQNITGRDLPCEEPQYGCPCADPSVSAGFAAIVAGQTPVTSCVAPSSQFPETGFVLNDGGAAAGRDFNGFWRCGNSSSLLNISPEQAQICMQLLEEAADRNGVTCGPITCPCAEAGFPLFPDFLAGQISATSCSLDLLTGTSILVNLSGGDTLSASFAAGATSCGVSPSPILSTTMDEARLCLRLLEEEANRQGFDCSGLEP